MRRRCILGMILMLLPAGCVGSVATCPPGLKITAGACLATCPGGYEDRGPVCLLRSQK